MLQNDDEDTKFKFKSLKINNKKSSNTDLNMIFTKGCN